MLDLLDTFFVFWTGFLSVALSVLELNQVKKLYDSILWHVLDLHLYVEAVSIL